MKKPPNEVRKESDMTEAEKLHGGARRLPARIVNGLEIPSQRVSWYEIAPGDECSRHVHSGKAETWLVITGTGVSRVGDNSIPVGPGDMVATPPGTPHGLRNTGAEPLRFVNLVQYYPGEEATTTEIDQ